MSLPQQVSPPSVALSDVAPTGVVGAQVVALPVIPADPPGEVSLGPGAAELLDQLDLDLFGLLERNRATGKVGEIHEIPVLDVSALANPDLTMVLLVGVGTQSADDLRRAGAVLARRTRGMGTVASSVAALADDTGMQAFVEGVVLGSFGFHRRSTGPEHQPVEQVVLAMVADADERREVVDRAMALAGASWLARGLALTPSNEKNPQWLAEKAADIARTANLDLKVWDEKALAKDGFGGILGVGRASATPPRLIQLSYKPAKSGRRTPHIVLVGKGITFDTGGLSIKPGDSMMNMKRDMTGGGVVMAVLGALADVDCPVRVTGLIAAAENAISGDAMRPGDVVRHYGGRTSEVTNTDAEGRLVMADALAYAVAELDPTILVDVATLTGAMKLALGQRIGGYFSNNDALSELIGEAGAAAGEPLWRMPLVEDYEAKLDSKIADADNAPKGSGGAITAALFLRHFTGGLPWAHIDLASVGDSPVDEFEWSQGATGFGARALLRWLELRDPVAGVDGQAV